MYIKKYAKRAVASVMCAITVLSVAACGAQGSDDATEDTGAVGVSFEQIEPETTTDAPAEEASEK